MKSGQGNYKLPLPEEAEQAKSQREVIESHWQMAVQMLQLVQNDYSQTRKQLEEVCRTFSQKEAMVSERYCRIVDTVTQTSTSVRSEKPTKRSLPPPSVASLRAYCFGSFEIFLNWKKIDKWHSLKAKSLLKFLVTRKKPVPKDVLIETLWPNCDPELGNNNLKTAVYSLRQTLSANEQGSQALPFVLFSAGQYLINPEVEVWVDIDQFEHYWLTGRNLEKDGRTDEAIREYCLAEELYRGDYLEDDPYAEWTLLRREALKDTYLTVLGKLANSFFKTTDYESCILYSQKILAKDPCQEEAYRWLIRCYSRLGQRHRAYQWYNGCVTMLKRELDTTPDRQTIALYHQLLHQDPI